MRSDVWHPVLSAHCLPVSEAKVGAAELSTFHRSDHDSIECVAAYLVVDLVHLEHAVSHERVATAVSGVEVHW